MPINPIIIVVDFNLAYIQQYGFSEPMVFHDKEGLGIKVPGPNFHVGDVRTCVGKCEV